jgi:hypothetical protein
MIHLLIKYFVYEKSILRICIIEFSALEAEVNRVTWLENV